MKALNITLTLDNDAFDEAPSEEIARILTAYALRVRDDDRWYEGALLRDINGNSVGVAHIVEG